MRFRMPYSLRLSLVCLLLSLLFISSGAASPVSAQTPTPYCNDDNPENGIEVAPDCPDYWPPASIVTATAGAATATPAGAWWLTATPSPSTAVPTSSTQAGCPQAVDLNRITSEYAVQCSRCWTTPTPVRVNNIPTQVLAVPTGGGSFQIPVIISGTPYTPTPAPLPGGGSLATSTPAPTNTPNPSGNWSIIYDFAASDHGFTTTIDSYYSGGGWRAGATNPGVILIYKNLPATRHITSIRVYASTVAAAGGVGLRPPLPNLNSPNGSIDYSFTGLNHTGNQIGIAFDSLFISGSNPAYSGAITRVEVYGDSLATNTPSPTPTASPTYSPWIHTPAPGAVLDCSVPQYRNTTPVAGVPSAVSIHHEACYTIVPDLSITIPGQGEVGLVQTDLCVTWVNFPSIDFLGITFSLDWLLIFPIGWLVRRLFSF